MRAVPKSRDAESFGVAQAWKKTVVNMVLST
jgi:hypothetical protein